MLKNLRKFKYNSGVTIIELIVVISIVAILSTMMFFDYGKFKSSISLQNLADDIALSVRKAQMYAVGARGINNTFNYGYGVHFTKKANTNLYEGSNKSFIIFVDVKKDDSNKNLYNINDTSNSCGLPVDTNECLEMLSITGADYISSIEVDDNEVNENSTVDVIYKRPDIAPTIYYRQNGNGSSDSINKLKITVSNSGNPGVTKTVTIYNNGQISVS